MNKQLQRILPKVQKPARYVGGEYGQIVKNKQDVRLRVAFCFPDTYEIGMSNVGMRILYGVMNEMDGVWCERVFAPWGDMEQEMRQAQIPLYALESKDPVKDFDLVAFTIGYEMSYTNILNMLELAHMPIYAKDRTGLHGIVFAGGVCAVNPEPLADFIDFFSLGEGEEMTPEILRLYEKAKDENWSKDAFLLAVSRIEGVYVPSLYEHHYGEDGKLKEIIPLHGAPEKVVKRIVKDLDKAYYPTNTIVPSTEIVHDRTNLEVFRGCIRGCRFCQAGFCYRPVRPRNAETLYQQGVESLENSGNHEITLSSLSTSDYKQLEHLADKLMDYCEANKINLSLPSLRADNFSRELMMKVQRLRKSSLTFAPEAGTQRLRDAINKNVTEEEILSTCATAFSGGWNNVKLYFMLGLPTETDEDVLGIADLVWKIVKTWKETATQKKRGLSINLATAFFVPKPFTPFQWEPQDTIAMLEEKQRYLGSKITNKKIKYNHHDARTSLIEAVLAKGDRRLSKALEIACEDGFMFDAWTEYFDYDKWMSAFERGGVDVAFYANRRAGEDEIFPWDVIDCGVDKDFFKREKKKAYEEKTTKCCKEACSACGANKLGGKNRWCPKTAK